MLEKLGKYRIDDVLGTGAMGIVYKAFDMNIERVVALKLFIPTCFMMPRVRNY